MGSFFELKEVESIGYGLKMQHFSSISTNFLIKLPKWVQKMVIFIIGSFFESKKTESIGPGLKMQHFRITFCNNVTGIELLGMQLLERSEGNTVVSPLSLFTSLSMASLGANGLTLEEIHRTLRLTPEALSRMGGIIASFQVFQSAAILKT